MVPPFQREERHRKLCPKQTSSIVSRITFFYVLKSFIKRSGQDLEEKDICEVHECLESGKLTTKLQTAYSQEAKYPKTKRPSSTFKILKILWRCFHRELILLTIVDTVYKVSSSNILTTSTKKLVDYFSPESNMTSTDAYYHTGMALGFRFFDAFYYHNYLLWLKEFGVKSTVAFCAIIYKKCMRINPISTKGYDTGKVLTLMTKDVSYVYLFLMEINNVFTELIQDIIIIYYLHKTIGSILFAGLGVLFLIIPFQLYLERMVSRARLELSKISDNRLQSTQEAVSSIKVIKMYTWESIFARKIQKTRQIEVIQLRKILYLQAVIVMSGSLITQVALYVVLTLFTSQKGTSAADISYTMACFSVLEFSFKTAFPHAGIYSAEMLAGVWRIFDLLDAEELSEVAVDRRGNEALVEIEDATLKIEENSLLQKITCSMKPGLNIVTGPIGCGKSSLLKIILGEYVPQDGKVQVRGKISYASQEPWLFPGSVRENIIFGEKFEEERYEKATAVCALRYDFENLLSDGDDTIIEENGMNLSEGQRSRINLARAIYRDSDIYLLDDSLAAVDVIVREHIFRNCVKEFLRGKICIFVTHDLRHIKEADQLIVLKNKSIDLIEKQELGFNTLKQIDQKLDSPKNVKLKHHKKEPKEVSVGKDGPDEFTELIQKEHDTENIYNENNKIGKVNFSVYKRYLSFGGGIFSLLVIIGIVLGGEFTQRFCERSFSYWVNDVAKTTGELISHNITNNSKYEDLVVSSKESFKMYSVMFSANLAAVIIKNLCFVFYMSIISINIHKAMITNVLHGTMDFFDKTFLGNILNRFATDLSVIDESLSSIVMNCILTVMNICGTFILLATVNPMYLIPTAIIAVILFLFTKVYLPKGRSLQRLVNSTRSGIVGHLNSTLTGMTTIRACNKEALMMSEFHKHQNINTSALHMYLMTQLGFGAYLSLISFLYCCYVIVDLFFFNITQAGDVGLVLINVFSLTSAIQSVISAYTDLETTITSVERVLEYTDVKKESTNGRELTNWPTLGSIEYCNVSLTYPGAKESVLREVRFKIAPGEKIGIVGRTGAGKSSILSTMFRLYDVDGEILVDNENHKTVALNCWRSKISIIPQDPLLFSGTIRYNIDPNSDFDDADIWKVIERVKLNEVITDLDVKLGGGAVKFSAGQKQLLCIARALIRKNKIVVMDEATARMDPTTDALINEIIRSEFSDCTVLNVTHRLNSVVDCDKIMVVEMGQLAEFDSVDSLLANQESIFHRMMREHEEYLII